MGEKVYRPILKEGDHLVRSKDNEGRVRGVSQDENNNRLISSNGRKLRLMNLNMNIQ